MTAAENTPPAAAAAPRDRRPARKKSARRRAREFALQGLYEWLVSGNDVGVIDAQMRGTEGFGRTDAAHFAALLNGCVQEAAAIDADLGPHVDRRTTLLSPIEHAVLMIGVYELRHCPDVPYRVAINEAVELAKEFGGTDGFKYVNGVLDKMAVELRPEEVKVYRRR